MAAPLDHLDRAAVARFAERLRADHGRVDVLVNDIWGAETMKGGPADWGKPLWALDIDAGLRLLRLAVETHLVTAHALLALGDDARGVRGHRGDLARRGAVGRSRPAGVRAVRVAALAGDPDRGRWNQRSVTAGDLADAHGVSDLDGSRPQVWRYIDDVRVGGADTTMGRYG